jgi:hypothetical protein
MHAVCCDRSIYMLQVVDNQQCMPLVYHTAEVDVHNNLVQLQRL